MTVTHRQMRAALGCFACDFRWGDPYHAGSRVSRETAAALYEVAVETVESYGAHPFTITDIARKARDRASRVVGNDRSGYGRVSMFTYAKYAVIDLHAHGLVECIRKDAPGRRCLLWQTTKGHRT